MFVAVVLLISIPFRACRLLLLHPSPSFSFFLFSDVLLLSFVSSAPVPVHEGVVSVLSRASSLSSSFSPWTLIKRKGKRGQEVGAGQGQSSLGHLPRGFSLEETRKTLGAKPDRERKRSTKETDGGQREVDCRSASSSCFSSEWRRRIGQEEGREEGVLSVCWVHSPLPFRLSGCRRTFGSTDRDRKRAVG